MPALIARQKTAPYAHSWKEKLGHDEEGACCSRYGVGTLHNCGRQGAKMPHNGAGQYMFCSIFWLSRQHGVYQRNNGKLAWKVFDWMV